tara:strand:+ start:135 stop:335 length:201 start_codon:yes stop_codon:yes gene_type:complete
MKWKHLLFATLLIYILGIDEWIMYYAAYADYCYKTEKFYNTSVKPGAFLSCFSDASTPLGNKIFGL